MSTVLRENLINTGKQPWASGRSRHWRPWA